MQFKVQNIPDKYRSIDKVSLAVTLAALTFITILTSSVPFFWDGGLYCQVAHYYYDTDFHSLILPPHLDAYGSPMLHWVYIAAGWKFFGKSLLVSHLLLLPILWGTAWEYYKFAKKFLLPKMIPLAMLLLICESVFMTQSIIMSYDISKVYFFLLGLNCLLNKNKFLYSIAIILLSFCSTRGLLMAAFLVPLHLFLNDSFKKTKIIGELKVYILPLIIFLAWIFFHQYQTGWFFYSSHPEFSPDRKTVDIPMLFRHAAFIIWQILDSGRVFIWAFIACGLFILKRNFEFKKLLVLFTLWSILLLLFIITISPLAGDVCHRYFIILFFLSHIIAIYILQELVLKKTINYLLIAALSVGLIAGNFWMYGGGLSNNWDSSLKIFPYFKLEDQVVEFTKAQNMNPESIGTKYPMQHNFKYTKLQKEDFHFTEIGNDSLEKFQFVLFSNVSNIFTVQEKNTLQKWKLIKQYKSGQVRIELFENPQPISRERL